MGKIKSLHYSRGLAAVVVMFGHILVMCKVSIPEVRNYFGKSFDDSVLPKNLWDSVPLLDYMTVNFSFVHFLGPFGVALFFIISGYVISLSFRGIQRNSSFLKSRFIRIYPTHWACLILVVCIMVATRFNTDDQLPFGATDFLLNLFNIHAFWGIPSINRVVWSLLVEEFFYFTIFLQFFITKRIELKGTLISLAALILLPTCRLLLSKLFGLNFQALSFLSFASTYSCFIYLGVILYIVERNFNWRELIEKPFLAIKYSLALGAPVGAMLFSEYLFNLASSQNSQLAIPTKSYLYACLAFFIVLYLKKSNFESKVLNFFGDISYPLYLSHTVVGWVSLYYLSRILEKPYVSIMITFVVILVVSYLVHRFIEAPSIIYSKVVKREKPTKSEVPLNSADVV